MTKLHVTLAVEEGFPLTEAGFDALADALYELDAIDPDLDDTDLTASLGKGQFLLAMTVTADEMPAALRKALATFRTALRDAGHGTPGWEQVSASMAASTKQLVGIGPVHGR
jgi:hypothetical protein